MLGFAIIGCGSIARFHARAIAEVRGAKLIGCYNRSPAKADALAAEFGVVAYSTLAALLADPTVNVVVIGTPSGAHLEPGLAAAAAGKHVIVEKPLEITLARCDRLIAACRNAGVRLSTIFPSRFHDAAIEMKRAVDEGRFGRLTLGDAYVKWFRSQQYYDSGQWRGTWELDGGGALMNQAIHSLDLLLYFMGPLTAVSARSATLAHERIAVEDTVVATLHFASGALGVIEATTAAYPGYLKRIELCGSTGSAVLEEEAIVKWDFARPKKRDDAIRAAAATANKTGGGASDPKAIGHHGHARQFRDMVDAIAKGREPAVDGIAGRRAVEAILAIYKAAETGKTVTLPLARDPALRRRKRKKPEGS
jgi:predicted dehydrogenase